MRPERKIPIGLGVLAVLALLIVPPWRATGDGRWAGFRWFGARDVMGLDAPIFEERWARTGRKLTRAERALKDRAERSKGPVERVEIGTESRKTRVAIDHGLQGLLIGAVALLTLAVTRQVWRRYPATGSRREAGVPEDGGQGRS